MPREEAMRFHPATHGDHRRKLAAVSTPTADAPAHDDAPSTHAPASRHHRRAWCPRVIDGEGGSLVTEYGLLAVVAATIAGAVMQWATGGALVSLFNALLTQARSLVGA